MPITESFKEAAKELASFVERVTERPFALTWLCREDITGYRRQLYVLARPPAVNRELHQRLYEHGLRQGRGMGLHVTCFGAGRAYAAVWMPADDIDANQSMLSPEHLRYSFATGAQETPFGAHCLSSSLALRSLRLWCHWRGGESPLLGELPRRAHLRKLPCATAADT